jgi:hypothetical protein
MPNLSIIGTGFVVYLYMRSLEAFPDIKVLKIYDCDTVCFQTFAAFWRVTPDGLLVVGDYSGEVPDRVLNLTNPASHFEISKPFRQ